MRWKEAPQARALILTRHRPRYRPPEALCERLLLVLGDGLRRVLALVVWVLDCCGLEGTLEGAHRISLFAGDRGDPAASWHLEDLVAMVGHCHELGQCWVPEDGVVWQTNVGDVESMSSVW